ncbi:voltage-dependent calcium channel subunit alpha-2/delta-3-like isoform X2 [Symsagittifera roscoffensis]|uniref:voltage-dependent calcium channel subunit alpha-2/delta-3-like isoform X2 n=1 Tax=Symsagittifera roscoffensis TaxID=84072 RepID=UPI00307BA818
MTLVKSFADKMEVMLGAKIGAILNIVDETEERNKNHPYREDLDFEYYNANFLNVYDNVSVKFENGSTGKVPKLRQDYQYMNFTTNDKFQDQLINFTYSTLQVPVNIYKKDPAVVNGIFMTESLNKVFYENMLNDSTLTWQYFASSTGFFRNYPGVTWDTEDGQIDHFDARDRPWYLQASHSPKDIVILLDTSGSMTGSREFVARNAIHHIIETLLDDDFFNIITFSEDVTYLEECFTDTLVQANSDNKEYLKGKTKEIESNGIANFERALEVAFKLLNASKVNKTGSSCSQAIMLLTDGAVENFEHIFTKYNARKEVRVFTYIIGRDVKNSEPVKWMACNNKGYYTQIATLADVKINIMQYIHVLSRPMVIEKKYQFKWTNVYMDVGSAGLRLMTTVSIPAFDKAVGRENEGNLLGVAGVDVPISEMNKFTPSFQLGFNGYTFAITNNGYIIFHPDLRPKYTTNRNREKDKPNYNSVDLSEVEMYDSKREPSCNNETQECTTKVTHKDELRTKIVNAEIGSHSLDNVVYQISDWTRAAKRNMSYFFRPLKQTPFRLGIALDKHFGLTEFSLEGLTSEVSEQMRALNYTVDSRWNYEYRPQQPKEESSDHIQLDAVKSTCIYCQMGTGEKNQLELIRQQQFNVSFDQKPCDAAIVKMVVEDAVITYKLMNQVWKKRSSMTQSKWGDPFPSESVVADFVATRSGFLRYQIDNRDEKLEGTMKTRFAGSPFQAEYFKIPSSAYSLTENEDILVYWVPTSTTTNYDGPEPVQETDHLNVLAAAQLVFAKSKSAGYQNKEKKAISSVVGVYLDLDDAMVAFNKSISNLGSRHDLTNDENNVFTKIESCTNSTLIDCYLLDHHGFVVMSENKAHVSKFFGAVDGNAMLSLVNHTLYNRMVLKDMQGMCVSEKVEKKTKSASNTLHSRQSFAANQVLSNVFGVSSFLLNMFLQLMLNCFSLNFLSLLSPWDAFDNIVAAEKTMDQLMEHIYSPCDMEKTVFLRDFKQPRKKPDANSFPCHTGSKTSEDKCMRDYLFQSIENTNLVFVVVMNKQDCTCNSEPMDLRLRKKEYTQKMERCSRLAERKHRMRPPECHSFHQLEDSKHCGRSTTLSASKWVLLLLPIVVNTLRKLLLVF